MPETHTSKSTAPDGESPKKPIIIGYPVPGSKLPSAERLGTSEEKARLELLSKVSVGLGRLAIGRRSDESGDSDRVIDRARIAFLRSRLYPDTPAYLLINTEDGSDDDNGDGSRRAIWMRVDQGDFSTTINPDSEENHGLPPAEDALNAWKAQFPQSENQPTEPPDNSEDARRMLRDTLRGAGKLNSRTEPESSTNEAVPATSKHGAAETDQSDPGLRPQTREEVLAALRSEHSSPAAGEDSLDGDSSITGTESESPAPENQDELGNSDEQDPNESPEVSDKQSPSASEALKRLAEADTTQSAIRNMAGAAEDLAKLNTADTLRDPVLFGRIQEFTSGILVMLNRFNGAVEEVGGDLPQDEAARLSDAIDQVRRSLVVMNNVAEQGFSGRIDGEEYSQYAAKLKYGIAELQRFMNVSVKRQENNEQG